MVLEVHGETLPPFAGGRKLRIALPLAMTQFPSVKCVEHQAEAIGICAYCGRALCAACARPSETRRLVCSNECAAALSRNDQALQSLLQKSVQNAQASAFYCYLCGGLSLGAAAAAQFVLPLPFLIYFTAACGIVFIVSGIWYVRTAKKQIPNP
jgi:predicted nucleic acid-binding Zn ribbon protein